MKGCMYYTEKYKDSHLVNDMWLYSQSFVFGESQVCTNKIQEEVTAKFNI